MYQRIACGAFYDVKRRREFFKGQIDLILKIYNENVFRNAFFRLSNGKSGEFNVNGEPGGDLITITNVAVCLKDWAMETVKNAIGFIQRHVFAFSVFFWQRNFANF